MEFMFIVLLIAICVASLVAIVIMNQRLASLKNNTAVDLLKSDLTELNRTVGELRTNIQETVSSGLEKNNLSMQRQLSQSAKLVADVTSRLTKLDETNRRVVDVADELKVLQNVLANPKQRGVLGEYYLTQVLENVLPPDRWQAQYSFKNGETVDAVIFLEKGKILPIDSKFSLENYNRVIEEKDKTMKARLVAEFKKDLKLRIDETAKYIRPQEKTMDFAFMFIPSEAIYYDLLINKVGASGANARDLMEYAFVEKKVIITSPTSFMAYLQTVLQGLRSLQIEEQAKDIQLRVGQLGKHIASYDQYMQKLGNSLGTTVNHYNNAHKELGKIDKDVVKIANTSPGVEALVLDKPKNNDL
jgi:DNA recombination protein RmuC